jgi:hypothetical protein
MVMGLNPKFKIGDSAFVMDTAECVINNRVCRIPLGTEVKVRTVSVLKARGYTPEVRYEVNFPGAPLVCWLDESRLTPRILDVL